MCRNLPGLCLVLLLAGCSGDSRWSDLRPPEGPNAALADAFAAEQASGSVAAFTGWIYPALARDANFVFSPYAVASGLAACVAGAQGPTAEELATALRLPPDRSLVPKGFSIITGFVPVEQDPSRAGFFAANGLWARRGTTFLGPFLASLQETFDLTASTADFSSGGAAGTIASWIEGETGLEGTALPADFPGRNDALDLLSHATTRGHWLHPFVTRQTLPKEFWVSPKRSVETVMLRTVDAVLWTWNWGVDVVDVPYVGGDLSMVVLVPRERDGLPQVEGWFADSLSSWLDRLQTAHMDFMVPRFRIETRYDLRGMLQALGVRAALSEGTADFGKLSGEPLSLTAFRHGASMDVGEKGSWVSELTPHAAPRLNGVRSSLYVRVHADRPFLFLVVERTRNTILLVGKVSDPRLLEGG